MNEIQIFKSESFGKVRVAGTSEKPLFCAKDVAISLGYSDTSDAIKRHCKSGEKVFCPHANGVGGTNMIYIPEKDVYRLIMRSNLPDAEKFQDWVCDEVLPSIRKHGIYATESVIDNILNNPDFAIELLTKLKEERTARIEAEKKNDILMHVNKTYTATEIAKELGLKSAVELNKMLESKKVQFKINGTWVLYSDYSQCGYEEVKQEVLDNGKVIYHRRFTQLGREFILKTLKK